MTSIRRSRWRVLGSSPDRVGSALGIAEVRAPVRPEGKAGHLVRTLASHQVTMAPAAGDPARELATLHVAHGGLDGGPLDDRRLPEAVFGLYESIVAFESARAPNDASGRRHCAQAVPTLPTQTAPQAMRAAAHAAFLKMLQPDGPTPPASGLMLTPRLTVDAWFGSLMAVSP